MTRNTSIIEQMLTHLINEETERAEELFHEYVVKQSRTIYESLIEAELDDMDQDDDMDDMDQDDGMDDMDQDGGMDLDDEDPTDDLASDLDDDADDDMGQDGKDPSELFTDLDNIVDELQARFDALEAGNAGDEDEDDLGDEDEDDLGDEDDEFGSDEDEELKDNFNYSAMREYVERVPAGHGAEKKGSAENADRSAGSMKFSKNDMGGTSSNILSGRNGADAGFAGAPGGKMKGSSLSDTSPKDMNTGNLNKVGGYKGSAYSRNTAGHGAEKKGSAEKSANSQSLFRGRR